MQALVYTISDLKLKIDEGEKVLKAVQTELEEKVRVQYKKHRCLSRGALYPQGIQNEALEMRETGRGGE
jgi:hypothetical protein